MKHIAYLIILFSLTNCSSFSPEGIESSNDGLIDIFNKLKEKGYTEIKSTDDDIIALQLTKLGIDKVVIESLTKNNLIGADSLVFFIRNNSGVHDSQKRIVYDYAKQPRKFGNADIPNAAYTRVMVNDRWYFETEGFD
jgi:hypothetical protein